MQTKAIVRLVICVIIVALLSGLLINVLALSRSTDFSFFGISLGGYSYENAEDYNVGPLSTGGYASIKEIDIDWISGSVEIKPSENGLLSLSETGNNDDDYTMRWLIRDGKLTVKFKKPSRWGGIKGRSKELTVLLPKELAAGLNALSVSSVSSSVDIKSVCADRIDVELVSGDLTAENVVCSRLNSSSVSGRVTFDGEVKDVKTDTVSGRVQVRSSLSPDRIDCNSVSANCVFEIPDSSGFKINFDKVSGKLISDFPTSDGGSSKIYGDGSRTYDFDTVSGDVELNLYK